MAPCSLDDQRRLTTEWAITGSMTFYGNGKSMAFPRERDVTGLRQRLAIACHGYPFK